MNQITPPPCPKPCLRYNQFCLLPGAHGHGLPHTISTRTLLVLCPSDTTPMHPVCPPWGLFTLHLEGSTCSLHMAGFFWSFRPKVRCQLLRRTYSAPSHSVSPHPCCVLLCSQHSLFPSVLLKPPNLEYHVTKSYHPLTPMRVNCPFISSRFCFLCQVTLPRPLLFYSGQLQYTYRETIHPAAGLSAGLLNSPPTSSVTLPPLPPSLPCSWAPIP